MRTTIDLPEDLHRITISIARDRGESLSKTVAELLRRALGAADAVRISRGGRSGLELIHLGRPITTDHVRALDDEP